MKYTVTINGKVYDLPARSERMDALINRMCEIDKIVARGELSRKESLQEQYDFVSECIPENMPEFSNIDVADLAVARMEIVTAYNEPVIQAKINTIADSVGAIVNRPEIQKLLLLIEAGRRSK